MSNAISNKVFFVGKHERPLDDKRRLTVPSKWRFSGDDSEQAFLALPNLAGSIIVYPPEMAARIYEKVSQIGMSNPAKQRDISAIFSRAQWLGCDKQGRIMLDEELLRHAAISKDSVLVGGLTNFQIWNPKKFVAWLGSGSESGISSTLSELGL